MIVEIQFLLNDFVKILKKDHRLYEIQRAKAMKELANSYREKLMEASIGSDYITKEEEERIQKILKKSI